MPKLSKKLSVTDGLTDPNYRKASILIKIHKFIHKSSQRIRWHGYKTLGTKLQFNIRSFPGKKDQRKQKLENTS